MDNRDFTSLLTRKCKRKEERKTRRRLQTICRVAFNKHKKIEEVIKEKFSLTKTEKKREKRRRQRELKAKRELENADDLDIFKREFQKRRTFLWKERRDVKAEKLRREVERENVENEREEIELMERKLGIKKKTKNVSTAVVDEAQQHVDEQTQHTRAESYVDDLFSALDNEDANSSTANSADDLNDDDEEEEEDERDEEAADNDDDDKLGEDAAEMKLAESFSGGENSSVNESVSDIEEDDEADGRGHSTTAPFDAEVLALAQKAKMDTPLRERIFCTLMSSTNSAESFESLKALSCSGPDEREIVNVCVRCTLLESHYNPYYGVVVAKFCEWRKQFRLTTQFALWDSLKALHKMKENKRENLAFLFADLIKLNAVGLTVFKVIDMSDTQSDAFRLLKRVVHRLLTNAPDATQQQAVMRLINSGGKNQRFADAFESFLGELDVDEFRGLVDFPIFQRQLAAARRHFALR